MACLTVTRSDHSKTQIIPISTAPLQPNEILVKVDKLALTTNNVTYGVLGQSMQYFDFFPISDFSRNHSNNALVPCWGIATVMQTCDRNQSWIRPGERIYGFFTLAEFVKLRLANENKVSFTVSRVISLPEDRAAYNVYFRLKSDVLSIGAQFEDPMLLYRPLWMTSFLLDDFLAENTYFGGKFGGIVVTSASSKTAYCFAFLVKKRMAKSQVLVGVTSKGNKKFVQDLGFYDVVLEYGDSLRRDMQNLARDSRFDGFLVTDFAGNEAIRQATTEVLRSNGTLKKEILVGTSHSGGNQSSGRISQAYNEKSESIMFFAPAWWKLRSQQLGGKFLGMIVSKWTVTMENVHSWGLQVRHSVGLKEAEKVYQNIIEGKINGADGHIIILNGLMHSQKL